MPKLIYKTKKPQKGYVGHESFSTHEDSGLKDLNKVPKDVEKEALDIVGSTMRKLIDELKSLGYDETKVGFFIHYKDSENQGRLF